MNCQSRCSFIELHTFRVYCIYKGDDRKRTKKHLLQKKVNKTIKFLEYTVKHEVWYFVHGLFMHIT